MTTLRPDREQVLRYLGHKGQEMSKALEDRLEGCIDLVGQAAAPRVCTGSFAIEKTEQGIQVSDTALVLTGRDIADLLKNSRRCFLMAATLGPEGTGCAAIKARSRWRTRMVSRGHGAD
ncbi:MAG: hypothetical protein ACLT0Y_04740 [Christensenellales bacterium]